MRTRSPSTRSDAGRRLPHEWRAFTIVELLVSMAVFSLLSVLLLQVSGGFTTSTQNSRRAMDAASEARSVLDRIGFDIGEMVRIGGVVPEFTKAPGNDSMRFLSNVRPAGQRSRLAVVDYQMDTDFDGDPIASTLNPDIKLGRAASPLDWSQTLGANLPLPANQHLVVGESIVRFEVTFLDENSLPISDPPVDGNARIELEKIRAIVVTVATLDPTSRAKLSDGDLQAINLPDPGPNENPLVIWNAEIGSSAHSQVVRENLRIFGRTYYLP